MKTKYFIEFINNIHFKLLFLLGCNLNRLLLSKNVSLNIFHLFSMSNLSVFVRSDFDNSSVTGTRYTINILKIGLRNLKLFIVEIHGNILVSSGLNYIFDLESFDALVFWNGSSAVWADNNSAGTSVSLISSIISSFLWHL